MESISVKKKRISTKEMIICSIFAALIAIGAFIKIPVPYVPFTMQLMFTTLAGVLLGANLGAVSVGVYLAIGLIGIPVFTKGGGIGYIFQPTFGYLIGFMIGAYVTGKIVEKYEKPSFMNILFAGLSGLSIVYLAGVPYFYFISNLVINNPIGAKAIMMYGFIMCLPGDIFTCIVCALLGKKLVPILRKERKAWK
ncbi:MAG: biotin transporter BioY [Proteocatella sp.]